MKNIKAIIQVLIMFRAANKEAVNSFLTVGFLKLATAAVLVWNTLSIDMIADPTYISATLLVGSFNLLMYAGVCAAAEFFEPIGIDEVFYNWAWQERLV